MKIYNKTYGNTNVQEGPVSFQRSSANRKLTGSKDIKVCSTYTSIRATCPSTCPFKDNGCYAQSGHTGIMVRRLDNASDDMSGDDVSFLEAAVIDQQWEGGLIPQDGRNGGRDLRLHVAGDVGTDKGAKALAAAAKRWKERGGGAVWTYTHKWKNVKRKSWGDISVFASVETLKEAKAAARRGYRPALTVNHFESDRAWIAKGSDLRVIPCPAQTRGRHCADCRLCLDRTPADACISFAVHGSSANKAKKKLPMLASAS